MFQLLYFMNQLSDLTQWLAGQVWHSLWCAKTQWNPLMFDHSVNRGRIDELFDCMSPNSTCPWLKVAFCPPCRPESPPLLTLRRVWNLRPGTLATPTQCALRRWWAWWVLVYACDWTVVTTPTTSGDLWTRQTSNRLEPVKGTETCCSRRWVSVVEVSQRHVWHWIHHRLTFSVQRLMVRWIIVTITVLR